MDLFGPEVMLVFRGLRRLFCPLMFCGIAFNRPGSDLLSRVLRRSTIGAGAFHGRVRNGNGCGRPAMTTRSIKGNEPTFLLACVEKLDFGSSPDLVLAG